LIAQACDRGIDATRLRRQGVGVQQRVTGDHDRAHEVVEQQMEDQRAAPLDENRLVHEATKAGTGRRTQQRAKVGDIARSAIHPNVDQGVGRGLEHQGQGHLAEDLAVVGVIVARAEIPAAGIHQQRAARAVGPDGVDRGRTAKGSGRARRCRPGGSIRTRKQRRSGHPNASAELAEASAFTAFSLLGPANASALLRSGKASVRSRGSSPATTQGGPCLTTSS
jgi:hypothetical protein